SHDPSRCAHPQNGRPTACCDPRTDGLPRPAPRPGRGRRVRTSPAGPAPGAGRASGPPVSARPVPAPSVGRTTPTRRPPNGRIHPDVVRQIAHLLRPGPGPPAHGAGLDRLVPVPPEGAGERPAPASGRGGGRPADARPAAGRQTATHRPVRRGDAAGFETAGPGR